MYVHSHMEIDDFSILYLVSVMLGHHFPVQQSFILILRWVVAEGEEEMRDK